LTPDLKSGIPQAVDIPAPVNEIKCLLVNKQEEIEEITIHRKSV
jgi:hypothetical protein